MKKMMGKKMMGKSDGDADNKPMKSSKGGFGKPAGMVKKANGARGGMKKGKY